MARAPERLVLFERALGRLDDAVARPEDTIVRDACIQRADLSPEEAQDE